MIFLPIFLFVDGVLAIRTMLAANILDLTRLDNFENQYTLFYKPFFGLSRILPLYYDWPYPAWVEGWSYTFESNAWVEAILWLLLRVPIFFFTYYIYEPEWSRNVARPYLWSRIRSWFVSNMNSAGADANLNFMNAENRDPPRSEHDVVLKPEKPRARVPEVNLI